MTLVPVKDGGLRISNQLRYLNRSEQAEEHQDVEIANFEGQSCKKACKKYKVLGQATPTSKFPITKNHPKIPSNKGKIALFDMHKHHV